MSLRVRFKPAANERMSPTVFRLLCSSPSSKTNFSHSIPALFSESSAAFEYSPSTVRSVISSALRAPVYSFISSPALFSIPRSMSMSYCVDAVTFTLCIALPPVLSADGLSLCAVLEQILKLGSVVCRYRVAVFLQIIYNIVYFV